MKGKYICILFGILVLNSFAFSTVPKRAVSTSQFTTEILLSIGAEKQMIGTAWLDNPILSELKEKYDKIPVLSEKNMSKELFYSVEPDFLTGWDSILDRKNLGPVEELKNNGVRIFIIKSLKSNKIETVYADILELGKIFNLEKNAKEVVEKMEKELTEIKGTLPVEKTKIFAYDSGTILPFTIGGSGIPNTLIELAGGKNIFSETSGNFINGSWEKVLGENPEFILIVDYGSSTAESKIKFLKEKSPIKDLEAVKNNKFIVVGLEYLSAGIRMNQGVKKIAIGLHGERKNAIDKIN